MRRHAKPLLAMSVFLALLAWSWPVMPAGCPHARGSAMPGGTASCVDRCCDSGCCHFRAPASQPSAAVKVGGPAAVPPFLLAMAASGALTPDLRPAMDRQPSILLSLVPPLYLLHASFLN